METIKEFTPGSELTVWSWFPGIHWVFPYDPPGYYGPVA